MWHWGDQTRKVGASYPSRSAMCTNAMSNGFALSTELLPLPVGSGPRLNNAVPSVQSHYRTFNPTTAAPPLCPAWVLWPSRFSPLGRLLWHRATGSHVPYKSLVWLRAAYMPDAARAGFRATPARSREKIAPPVLTSPMEFRHSRRRSALARLSGSYLTGSNPAFCCNAHHHRF